VFSGERSVVNQVLNGFFTVTNKKDFTNVVTCACNASLGKKKIPTSALLLSVTVTALI